MTPPSAANFCGGGFASADARAAVTAAGLEQQLGDQVDDLLRLLVDQRMSRSLYYDRVVPSCDRQTSPSLLVGKKTS